MARQIHLSTYKELSRDHENEELGGKRLIELETKPLGHSY